MSVTDLFMLQQTLIAGILIVVAMLIARLHRMIALAIQTTPKTEGSNPKTEEKKQPKPMSPTPTLTTCVVKPSQAEEIATSKEGEEKPTLFQEEVRGK